MIAPPRRLTSLCIVPLLVASAQAKEVQIETDDHKALYSIGHQLSQRITMFELTEEELAYVELGMRDGAMGKESQVPPAESGTLREFVERRRGDQAAEEKQAGAAFLAEEAAKDGAVRFDSGLVMITVSEAGGEKPKTTDTVKVHYHGTLRDGTVFDSSVERNEPAVFPLGRVIPCWQEALQQMSEGGKARVVCPPDIAYGDRGSPPTIRPGATLAFDVELIAIMKKADEPGATE